MATRPRWNHSPAFKAKVALAAIRGEQTLVGRYHINRRAPCRRGGKGRLAKYSFQRNRSFDPTLPAVA